MIHSCNAYMLTGSKICLNFMSKGTKHQQLKSTAELYSTRLIGSIKPGEGTQQARTTFHNSRQCNTTLFNYNKLFLLNIFNIFHELQLLKLINQHQAKRIQRDLTTVNLDLKQCLITETSRSVCIVLRLLALKVLPLKIMQELLPLS